MNKQKKAQIQQIFVYMIGVVIVGLVLLLGYKGISSVMGAADSGKLQQFENTLQNDIDTSSSFGRQSTRDYLIPGDYAKICFAHGPEKGSGTPPDTGHALVDGEIESGTQNNVFLITADNEITAFATEDIQTGDGVSFCHDIENNKVKLRYKGKGDHTVISVVG